MDQSRLQQIYDDAGRPRAQAFRFAVRRAGLQLSEAEAKAFVSRQSAGQVFQGRIVFQAMARLWAEAERINDGKWM